VKNYYNVIIVGGGVIGTAIARELAKYKLSTAILEKESDVGLKASTSNSGVIHAGFSYPPGSLKAELCMRGNELIKDLTEKLGVPFNKTGKLVVAFNRKSLAKLYEYEKISKKNGAEVRLIGGEEVRKMEPNLAPCLAALYSPNSAIINPFQFITALAENALHNGVDILLNTEVKNIDRKGTKFEICTSKNNLICDYVINAAGLYSAEIARKYSGEDNYKIFPCKGEYHVLDKNISYLISHLIYPVPFINDTKSIGGSGIHLTPTTDGNILIGPSDEYIEKRNDYSTTNEIMDLLTKEAKKFVPKISSKDIIKSYSGIRSKIVPPEIGGYTDFVIEKSPDYDSFLNLIGIESPGLTAAPGIAEYVVNMIDKDLNLKHSESFYPEREKPVVFADLPENEQNILIEKNPNYGEIICRCEKVTRQEILDALNNPLGVRTIKSLRNRTRITMGRCQGGYCLERVADIMLEEGLDLSQITLDGEGSNLFSGLLKGVSG